MTRRLFGPAGLCVAFLGVATLVFGGLGWVTVAALGVEQAQREAAARADRVGQERIALWRLDGHLLPAVGVESNRPFAHYTTLHAPFAAVDADQNTLAAGSLRLPSPLLSAELPAWMLLHFQIGPDTGWVSPQVIPDDLADQLQAPPFELALTNVTPERRALLADLAARFPAADTLRALATLDQVTPDASPFVVPVPFTDETAVPKPAGSPGGDEPARPRPAPKSLWFAQQIADAERASARKDVVPVRLSEAGFARQYAGASSARGSTEPGVPTAASPTASFPSYGFNRATSNSAPVAPPAIDPMAKPIDRPEYAARLKATQQSLEQRGSYQNKAIDEAATARNRNSVAKAVPETKPRLDASPIPADEALRPYSRAMQPGDAIRSSDLAARPPVDLGGFPGLGPPPGQGQFPSNPAGGAPSGTALPAPSRSTRPTPVAATIVGGVAANTVEQERLFRKLNEPAAGSTPPGARKRPPAAQSVAVHLGPLRPHWLTATDGTDVLVLVRSARLEHTTVYQGVLLDWPRVREVLLAQVPDLFPAAKLTPAHAADTVVRERVMTALPVQLDPGPAPALPPTGITPLRVGLMLAWAAAVVALVAVGVGGRALVDLSERRIRFVSAVTHELRTPLTSLRLYLDLLTSGMIADEAKQKEYLQTLAGESDRLNRLIENVLDFAKLEKRSVQAVLQPTPVDGLLTDVRQTWADRCAADGMELVAVSTLPPNAAVTTDPRMATQILGNLVDNARKYARGAEDPRVWVWAKPGGRGRVVFEVEDRGPGVPVAERGSVFRPFRRGHAADTIAGGAGLGLALAKHWADLLGGRLSYRPADGGTGACFRLELPTGK